MEQAGRVSQRITQIQKDAEEADFKKFMKEKSTFIIEHSLAQLTKACIPKCISMNTSHIDSKETACLIRCVRTLQKSHVTVFNHMIGFESQMQREEEELAEKIAKEAAEEERARIKAEKQVQLEEMGMVRMRETLALSVNSMY
jgi:predicted transcriptional regulator